MSRRPIRSTLFSDGGVFLSATNVTSNDGDGIILTLALNRHDEKNVVNPSMVSSLVAALDVIDGHPECARTNNKALIITGLVLDDDGGTTVVDEPASKFFSNGLDLEWMMRANAETGGKGEEDSDGGGSGSGSGNAVSELIESFNSDVLARILTLPLRTVAAINGHCIGAGLFLALACDYRIMRTERGYLQWPEANLGMRLTKGFAELSKAKVAGCHRNVVREGVLGARRYTSREAIASGIVDAECPIGELYDEAFRLAAYGLPESELGLNLDHFDPVAYSDMKVEMYADAFRALKFGKVGDPPHSRI
jgi:enoyl-CoA hydratase/carnithine racemase